MAAGETLLKITDFPFSYSFIAIMFSVLNLDISGNKILFFIGISGSLGTFLTITDPLGRAIKYRLKRELQKIKKEHIGLTDQATYSIQAICTRSVSLEVDKLVSLAYFVIILLVFNYFISYDDSFASKDQLIDSTGKLLCDKYCVKVLGNAISFIAALIVAYVGVKNWIELKKHVLTAGIHQRAIGSEYTTQPTKDSMSKAIEQNDWPTAEEWGKILENEIKIQKGKKELLTQLVQEVFRPLYLENLSIEAVYDQSSKTGNFQAFPNGQWVKLRTEPLFGQIDDTSFRDDIASFYKLIEEYNQIQQSSLLIAQNIVNKSIPEVFGQNIRDIRYWIKSIRGETAPSLPNLILTGTHPLKPYATEENAKPERMEFIQQNSSQILSSSSPSDFDKFEILWARMLEAVKNNEKLQRMKNLFELIHTKNTELKDKYVERIERQWKI